MSGPMVYVALQQFCEHDERPRRVLLEAGCEVRQNTLGRRLRREDLREVLREADAVLAGVEPYDAELLAALPRLRCISRCGVGTDSIGLEAARRLGIAEVNIAKQRNGPTGTVKLAFISEYTRFETLAQT